MTDFQKGDKVRALCTPHWTDYLGGEYKEGSISKGDLLEVLDPTPGAQGDVLFKCEAGIMYELNPDCFVKDYGTQGGGALKFDDNKPDPTLVPPKATLAVAKALGYGAKKYGRNNFRQEPRLSRERLMAGVMRHLLADIDGERLDPESGLPHTWHAMAGLAMLTDGEESSEE